MLINSKVPFKIMVAKIFNHSFIYQFNAFTDFYALFKVWLYNKKLFLKFTCEKESHQSHATYKLFQ